MAGLKSYDTEECGEVTVRKFYTKSWFGIDYSSFSELSVNHLPSDAFYEKFYTLFYEKYKDYKQLPLDYQKNKQNVAEHLGQILAAKQGRNILSIGSGNGIIEEALRKKLADKKLIAIEPSQTASRWLRANPDIKVYQGFFPEALPNQVKPDFAYCVALDYVFDDQGYECFLKQIIEHGITDFAMYHLSIYKKHDLVFQIKNSIKHLLAKLSLYQLGQFWGYLRTLQEHDKVFKKAGFSSVSVGELPGGITWIRGKVEK